MAHSGQMEVSAQTQKRAVASKALPVSDRFGLSLTTASGPRQTRTHRADVASVAPPTPHVRGAEGPSVPAPRHTRGHPSDDIRRSTHAADSGVGRDVPRWLSGDRLSQQPRQPAMRRSQGQALKRSLIEVYALCSSCYYSCMRVASLMFFHRWRAAPSIVAALIPSRKPSPCASTFPHLPHAEGSRRRRLAGAPVSAFGRGSTTKEALMHTSEHDKSRPPPLTCGCVCSGISAPTLAAQHLGCKGDFRHASDKEAAPVFDHERFC
jgi:hypothetical protein